MNTSSTKAGLSIIIVTYKRDASVFRLIKEIAQQRVGVSIEIIIVDNNIRGILARRFPKRVGDIRVRTFSFGENLGCWIRFKVATFASFDKIMFLDDDVQMLSRSFLSRYLQVQSKYRRIDILSSWCQILKAPKYNYFDSVPVSFLDKSSRPKEVDIIGPGISLMNRCILTDKIYNIPPRFKDADNVWISLQSTLVHGTKKYYCPTRNMVCFRDSHKNGSAMYKKASVVDAKSYAVSELTRRGYIPLLKRNVKQK